MCAASAASDNLQYARYFREESQKQILGTLFHLLVCSASLYVPQGCICTSLCAFQPQVSQAGGLFWRCPHISSLAQNMQHPSSHKDLGFAYGARGLETSVVVWERSTEPSIFSCREVLGTSPGLAPGSTAAAPLFCTSIAREKAGTSTNDLFPCLPCRGVGEEP